MYYIKSLFFCGCQRKYSLEKAKERIIEFAHNPNNMNGLLDPLIKIYNHIKTQLNNTAFENKEYGGDEVADALEKFINQLGIKEISKSNYEILEKNINRLSTTLSRKTVNPKTSKQTMHNYAGAMKVLAEMRVFSQLCHRITS